MAIYQGDKLVAENITIDKSLYTLPVGSIIPYGSNTAPTGFLLCDGSEVSKETYPDLYVVIGDSFGTATDGKFKLPDLRGKFVQGANGDLATVKEAGLPNITGQFYHDTNTRNKVSGAFSYTSGNNQNLMNDAPTNSGIVYFDASKSNAIYGNSDTVQPPAVCLSYIIKTLKISDEPNDQYATKDDIAKKVDKVDGMSLIEDTEKERLATVVNYDDTEIKADISKCATKDVATTTKNGLMSATDKKKINGLATVATTGSYNDLKDKPSTSDYTVFMQETQPTQDGLWIKGSKKDFRFTHGVPKIEAFAKTLSDVETLFSGNACSVAVDNKIYIFESNSVYCFLPESHTFSKITSMGGMTAPLLSCAYINEKIYTFGIDIGDLLSDYKGIGEFNLSTNEYTKNSAKLPYACNGSSAVAINGCAYIFGCSSGSGTLYDSILKFDPSSDTVSELTVTLPSARGGASVVAYAGKAYIFGGRSNGNNLLTDILEFDPVKETVNKIASLPTAKDDQSITLVDNIVYLFGGTISSGVVASIFKFDCVTKKVTTLGTSLPYAEYNGASSAVSGHSYIFSGVCGTQKIKTIIDFVDEKSITFNGYYINIDDSGIATEVSSNEVQKIKNVFSGTNFDKTVKAYSITNSIAIEIK